MKRVLITRPEPGASQTAERVAALGLVPIVAPVSSITAREVRLPNRIAATLLTSRNAVPSCPHSVHDRPVFAVGTATANAATAAGFTRVYNADGDAVELATLVANTLAPADGTLFLPTAQGQGSELAKSLRQRGFRILRRVAYQVTPASTLSQAATCYLRLREIAVAMFFSSETARHFVSLLLAAELGDVVRDVEAVSISERAAMALRQLPWRRISVAAKPNQDAMLALLQ